MQTTATIFPFVTELSLPNESGRKVFPDSAEAIPLVFDEILGLFCAMPMVNEKQNAESSGNKGHGSNELLFETGIQAFTDDSDNPVRTLVTHNPAAVPLGLQPTPTNALLVFPDPLTPTADPRHWRQKPKTIPTEMWLPEQLPGQPAPMSRPAGLAQPTVNLVANQLFNIRAQRRDLVSLSLGSTVFQVTESNGTKNLAIDGTHQQHSGESSALSRGTSNTQSVGSPELERITAAQLQSLLEDYNIVDYEFTAAEALPNTLKNTPLVNATAILPTQRAVSTHVSAHVMAASNAKARVQDEITIGGVVTETVVPITDMPIVVEPLPDHSDSQEQTERQIADGATEIVTDKQSSENSSVFTVLPRESAAEKLATESPKQEPDRPTEVTVKLVEPLAPLQSNQRQTLQLRLEPEHLGPASLRLELQNEVVSAKLIVETIEAKQTVERSLETLTQQLNQAGLKVEQLEVTLRNSAHDFFQYRQPQWNRQAQTGQDTPSFNDTEGVVEPIAAASGYANGQYITAERVNLVA